jgi:hypothetical protein
MTELTVTASYLNDLAELQDQAAAEINTATSGVNGSAENLWYDHGLICGSTATAMQRAEREREDAGSTMQKVSEALAEDLRNAAAGYTTTDEQTGSNVDKQMLAG